MIRRAAVFAMLCAPASAWAEGTFPRELSSYPGASADGWWPVIGARAAAEPFNLAATVIFLLAVLHTFFAPRIRHWGHLLDERHRARWKVQFDPMDRDE